MDILQQIIATKRDELAHMRRPKPSLRQALLDSPTGIIAEFKRRSPSKGWIKEDGRPDQIPLSYQQNGAAALSILTDRHYFGGHDDFIRAARHCGVTLPILYKNFVVDELQLYEALLCGASAVLLIAACLSKERCAALLAHAHTLGLEVLLEMHSESELDYATLGPDLCGINNRHLGSFVTDVATSFRLAEKLRDIVGVTDPTPTPPLEGRGAATALSAGATFPEAVPESPATNVPESPAANVPESPTANVPESPAANVGAAAPLPCRGGVGGGVSNPPVLVSESGISDPATVRDLRAAGFRGFLIGETFMKTPDPGRALNEFISKL